MNADALCCAHCHRFGLLRRSGEAADTAPLYCCNPLNTPLTHDEDIPHPRKEVRASATAERRRGPSALATKTRERISQHEEVSAAARSLVATGCAVQKKQRGETADVHLLGLPCCSWSLSGTSASFSLRSFVSACPPRTNDLRPSPVCCFLLVCVELFSLWLRKTGGGGGWGSCAPLPPTAALARSLSLSLSGFTVHASN